MEKILAAIAIVASGIALFFYNNSVKSKRNTLLSETKGEDKQLKKQQDEIENKIGEVENRDDSKLTPEERADRWNK